MATFLNMTKKVSFPVLSCLLLILVQNISAQGLTVAQLSEEDFFGDFPVVLTATKLKQSKSWMAI